DDEQQAVRHRLPEQRVIEEALIILQPDKAQIANVGERINVKVGKAQDQRGGRGQEEEKEDRRERGARHQPAGTGFLHAPPCRHSARPFSSIQRRFSSNRSARRSISRAASSTPWSPRTMRSATSCISVTTRSHSGTLGK